MAAPWLLWLLLQAGAPETDARALQEEARTVRLELEAARSGDFYLVVNLSRSTLSLELRGVTLESLPFESIEVGQRLGSDSESGPALAPLFLCHAPEAPAPPEIGPGDVAPVEPPPADEARPLSLDCEPSLELRFVPTASKGLFTALKNRFGGSSDSPTRVVVTIRDEAASRLASLLPDELRVLFSRSEAP